MSNICKQKAVWDRITTKFYIDACLEQALKGERTERSLTKKGWKGAVERFRSLSGRNYDKTQFKNKWENLRREWLAWYNLFQHVTGLGWDNEKNTVIASTEWWDAKELEDPHYGKYRYEGLPYACELTQLFKDKTTTSEFAWAPLSRALPDDVERDHHCNEGFQSGHNYQSEGSGDSEDPNIGVDINTSGESGSIGVTNLNLNTSQGTNSTRSGSKRKRRGENIKKGKMDTATMLGQHVNSMVGAIGSHASAIIAKSQGSYSIGVALGELHKFLEVVENAEFYCKCLDLLQSNSARETFCEIPEDRLKLVYLKHATRDA